MFSKNNFLLRRTCFALCSLLLASSLQLLSMTVMADLPGAHPGMSRMLADLRAANWHMAQRGDDAAVRSQLSAASSQINLVLASAGAITVDEGKNRPAKALTTSLPLQVRLQKAAQLLQKAQHNLAGEVDAPDTRAARKTLKLKIDLALQSVNQAMISVESMTSSTAP